MVESFRRSVIIANYGGLKSQELGKSVHFWRFFWKNDPLRGNFQNSVTKGFTTSPIHVLRVNFLKFGRPEIGKVVRYLPDKKTKIRLALPLSLLRRSRPKSARANFRQNRVPYSSKSVHFRRNYSRTREHCSNAP